MQILSGVSVRLAVAATAMAVLAGCTSNPTVPVNYAPSSVMSASGSMAVSTFKYLPAEPRQAEAAPAKKGQKKAVARSAVKANQIRNTALGSILIDRDVSTFFRDAVFAELRFVGVKLDNPSRSLGGEIVEFLIDDLGYSIDWTLTVKYRLQDPAGAALYEGEKVTVRNTAKFANVFGAMNETIKLNVEEILKDPAFVKAIAAPATTAGS